IGAALARGITLVEARRLVEVHTARLAAERRTKSDVREIRRALSIHAELVDRGQLTVEPSVRFHVAIGDAAHNDSLASFVHSFSKALVEPGSILEAKLGFPLDLAEHTTALEPIEAGDPDTAADRMRQHLDAVEQHHEDIGIR